MTPTSSPRRPRSRTMSLITAHGTMLARTPGPLWLGPVLRDWRFGIRRP